MLLRNDSMEEARIRELEEESRSLALKVTQLCRALRRHPDFRDIANQLGRAANSVAANHRTMTRARSPRDFAAKLCIVHEEADETVHWLGILKDSPIDAELAVSVNRLFTEASRLRNFFGHARGTMRRRHRKE